MRGLSVALCASTAMFLGLSVSGCNDELDGQGGVGQVCSGDIDCVVGLKCIENRCILEPSNAAPVADAGPNKVTVQGLATTLSGAASSDPEGDALVYQWSLATKPGGSMVILGGDIATDTEALTFTPDAAGIYELTLSVSDGANTSAASDVAVFVFDQEGNFPTVPDGATCLENFQCASGDCTDGICVSNFRPTAFAGPSREVAIGDTVALDGTTSSDPDGDALSYYWQLTQAPTGSITGLAAQDTPTTSFVADVQGLYVVTLRVNDGKLPSDVASVGIYAGDQLGLRDIGDPCSQHDECTSGFCFADACKTNEAPTADPGLPQVVSFGTTVALSGANSNDPELLPLTFTWDINKAPDGSTATLTSADTETPGLTPDLPGLYLLRLVVNDGQQSSLPAVVAVVVEDTGGLPVGAPCVDNGDCASNKCTNLACAGNAAPVANAGVPQQVDVGAMITLDGTASNDPDGDPISHAWTLIAPGGSTAVLNDPTAPEPTFVGDLEGIYQIGLIVSDGNLDSVESITAVVVSADVTLLPDGSPCVADADCASSFCGASGCVANTAPVAVVDELLYGEPGTLINLDGSASSDAQSQPLAYQWTLTETPTDSSAVLSDATAVQPTLTPDVPGVYFFKLVVNDGYDNSLPAVGAVIVQAGAPEASPCVVDAQCLSGNCSATTNVCEANLPPVADAGSPQVRELGELATADGSASTDPEGKPLTYVWSFTSVPAGSAATLDDENAVAASFTADLEGLYLLRLSVSDGYNVSDAGVAVVAVPAGLLPDGDACTNGDECISGDCTGDVCVTNTAPIAVATGPTNVVLGAGFTADGSGSSDGDGEALTYAWSLISAPAGSSAVLSATDQATADLVPDAPGTYSLLLIVNDGKVDSLPVGLNVVVGPNGPPLADLVVTTPSPFVAGAEVALDGSGSSDPNNDGLTYSWSFLTRPASSAAVVSGTGASATFTPDVAGTYVARLTVSDGALSDYALEVVIVTGPNTPPIADAGADTQLVVGGQLYMFGHNSSDPDGDTLNFSWTVLSEPLGSAVSVTDSNTAVANTTLDVEGEYTFELTVNDGQDSATDVLVVAVAAAEVPLNDYWSWVGDLTGQRVLYYVDNTTYERWTFEPGFSDASSGVNGVLLNRERLGPWATQDAFDWVVDWDGERGLVLVGLHGVVPGLGKITTAAEPPLVLYPLAVFSSGSQTFYSLVQTVDASGATISEVMRRTVMLDENSSPNPVLDFSNGIAGGLGTDALMLDVRTKVGQDAEVVAQQALVPLQGLFAERRAAGILDAEELFSPSVAVQTLALVYNDTVPTPGGALVEPATTPTVLPHVPSGCLPDPVPCVDNLNESTFQPSADCPGGLPYCRFEGTCSVSPSINNASCPAPNIFYSPLDPFNQLDWSGQTPIWIDPVDQVEVPGIPEGMDLQAIYLATGDVSLSPTPYNDQHMLFGYIELDDAPFPNMKYTLALRQNPPENTVGDVFIEFVFDLNGGFGQPMKKAGGFGPWTISVTQTVSYGVGPDLSCQADVTEFGNGLAFRLPLFAYGGYDDNEGRLPSIYELLLGYDPSSYGSVQDEANRAVVQFEACGLYADGCSDAVLAPLTLDVSAPDWDDSFDYCNFGGGSEE